MEETTCSFFLRSGLELAGVMGQSGIPDPSSGKSARNWRENWLDSDGEAIDSIIMWRKKSCETHLSGIGRFKSKLVLFRNIVSNDNVGRVPRHVSHHRGSCSRSCRYAH